MKRVNVQFAHLEPKKREYAADLHIRTSTDNLVIQMSGSDLTCLLGEYLEACVKAIPSFDDRYPTEDTLLVIQGVQYAFPDSIITSIVDDMGPLIDEFGEKDDSLETRH